MISIRSVGWAALAVSLVAGCGGGGTARLWADGAPRHDRQACEQYANQQGQMFGMFGRGLSGEMNAQVWQQRCIDSHGQLLLQR
jgi:hypothetical protein